MIEAILAFCAGIIVGIIAAAIYLHSHTAQAVAAISKVFAETEGVFSKKTPTPPPPTTTPK